MSVILCTLEPGENYLCNEFNSLSHHHFVQNLQVIRDFVLSFRVLDSQTLLLILSNSKEYQGNKNTDSMHIEENSLFNYLFLFKKTKFFRF